MYVLTRLHASEGFDGEPKTVYEFGPDKAPLLEFFNELIKHDDLLFAELSQIVNVKVVEPHGREAGKQTEITRLTLCRFDKPYFSK